MNRNTPLDKLIIRTAVAVGPKMGFVYASNPTRERKGEPHTIVFTLNKGEIEKTEANFDIISACLFDKPAEGSLGISEMGYYDVSTDEHQVTDDIFTRSHPVPSTRRAGGIRAVRQINEIAYAIGFRGVVYRLDEIERWTRIDEGLPESFDGQALHGLSSTSIFAAGLKGGVYSFNGETWTKQNVPTDANLTCVQQTPDGSVYIGGHTGTLLVGHTEEWRQIDTNGLNLDIWDLEWFANKLFVSSLSGVFTLEREKLVPVDFGEAQKPSTYQLSTYGGVLWSHGERDIMEYDGHAWSRVI